MAILVQESAGQKIVRNSARKNRFRKKANHERNVATRAALYSKHALASSWNKDVESWHETLRALSLGTA